MSAGCSRDSPRGWVRTRRGARRRRRPRRRSPGARRRAGRCARRRAPAGCGWLPGSSPSRRHLAGPDKEWAVIGPLLPAPSQLGRPLVHARRAFVNAILYVNRTGCAWRYLPKDFPPWRTVYGYFARWRDDGTLQKLHDRLRDQARAAAGRDPRPTAAVIDSQSVKAADTVPKASRGWDNAKKVNGRKRHIAVDATGLLLAVVITAASVQDRDAARPLLWNLRRAFPSIKLAWADGI